LKDTAGKLRKLKKQEVERLRDRVVVNINSGDMQNQTCNRALQVPTRVDLPLGELANPEMSELIKDWTETCTFTLGEITSQHQFNAQGIEGLVKIENVPLNMALLAARKIGIYRIEIFVPWGWTYNIPQGSSDLEADGSGDPAKTKM
jgi:hypothetical protein